MFLLLNKHNSEPIVTRSHSKHVANIHGYIDTHNEALRLAEEPLKYASDSDVDETEERKTVVTLDTQLFIDKSTILPDATIRAEHEEKLKKVFWNF